MKHRLLFAGDACDFRSYINTLTVKKLGSYLTTTETSSNFTEIEFFLGFCVFFQIFGPRTRKKAEL